MKWKRIEYLKKTYFDCVLFFLEKGRIISYDEVFIFFKTKESLEKYQISYIIFDNLKIIDFHFFKENNYFFYKILYDLVKKKMN